MVLYAVTVSFIILLTVVFMGPLELFALRVAGLNLIESFAASIQSSTLGIEVWINGGLLFIILILQPIVLGVFVLKAIGKIFELQIIERANRYANLKLNQSGESKPESKQQIREIAFNKELRKAPPPIANVGPNLSAASIHDVFRNQRRQEALMSNIISMLWFRGSKIHILLIVIVSLITIAISGILLIWEVPINLKILKPFVPPLIILMSLEFILLTILFGPTLWVYLALVAFYVNLPNSNFIRLRISYSFLYKTYRKASWESNVPYLGKLKRAYLKTKAGIYYFIAYFSSWVELSIGRRKRHAYQVDKGFQSELNHRMTLPSLAQHLETVAELRGAVQSYIK